MLSSYYNSVDKTIGSIEETTIEESRNKSYGFKRFVNETLFTVEVIKKTINLFVNCVEKMKVNFICRLQSDNNQTCIFFRIIT